MSLSPLPPTSRTGMVSVFVAESVKSLGDAGERRLRASARGAGAKLVYLFVSSHRKLRARRSLHESTSLLLCDPYKILILTKRLLRLLAVEEVYYYYLTRRT